MTHGLLLAANIDDPPWRRSVCPKGRLVGQLLSVHKRARSMITPLFKAIKRGDVTEVRRLLMSGADPNEAADFWTPLAYAAAHGNTPIVTLLLQSGAKPTWSAVQSAAFGNHARTVRVLLAAGADVDPPPGETPLLNGLKWSGFTQEQQARVRQLLRDAGGRELPEWYLRWRWTVRYGWRWRLRRWLSAHGWQPSRRRMSN
jgi:hypothetical protein